MNNTKFIKVVERVLAKYQDTPLRDRWEEAVSFGTQANAVAYWVRDSEDVVNIVWLSPNSIRDITWFPSGLAVFSFLPLRSIAAIEVRESPDIAKLYGYTVTGNLMIRVFCTTDSGDLVWVAATKQHAQKLRAFAQQVFTAYTTAVGA